MSAEPEHAEHDAEEEPRGTLVLLLCFLGLIALMWGWMYFLLLSRT